MSLSLYSEIIFIHTSFEVTIKPQLRLNILKITLKVTNYHKLNYKTNFKKLTFTSISI